MSDQNTALSEYISAVTKFFNSLLESISKVLRIPPIDEFTDYIATYLRQQADNSETSATKAWLRSLAWIIEYVGDIIQELLDLISNFLEELANTSQKDRTYVLKGLDEDPGQDDSNDSYEFNIPLRQVYFGNITTTETTAPTYIIIPKDHYVVGKLFVTANLTGVNSTTKKQYKQFESFKYSFNAGDSLTSLEDDSVVKDDSFNEINNYDVLQLVDYFTSSTNENLSSIDRDGRNLVNTLLTYKYITDTVTGRKKIAFYFKGSIEGTKQTSFEETLKVGVTVKLSFISLNK